tara:strand:+ start:3911 stop:4369 length:459 start_codon:yes stop_codon:yes gene_type:complete
MDSGLLKHLGISEDQVKQGNKRDFPEWFDKCIEDSQAIILTMVSREMYKEPPHWAIPEEQIHRVFEKYNVTGNWRRTNRQLGICKHGSKVISLNFGHNQMDAEQGYRTMVHEYIHALQYQIFGISGHDKQFWFYLHLCVPTLNKHAEQRTLK